MIKFNWYYSNWDGKLSVSQKVAVSFDNATKKLRYLLITQQKSPKMCLGTTPILVHFQRTCTRIGCNQAIARLPTLYYIEG